MQTVQPVTLSPHNLPSSFPLLRSALVPIPIALQQVPLLHVQHRPSATAKVFKLYRWLGNSLVPAETGFQFPQQWITTFQDSFTTAILPISTNAVEAHNRISKCSTPGPLNVAMLMTYKEDMLAALEHLTCFRGISTTYEDQSLEAKKKRATKQNAACRK